MGPSAGAKKPPPEGPYSTACVTPKTERVSFSVTLTAAAAAACTADDTACCDADKGAVVIPGVGEAAPAAAKPPDWAAELELKGLVASGVASGMTSGPDSKLLLAEEEELEDESGLMGTNCKAAYVSSRPPAIFAESAVLMDAAAEMISCLTCSPTPLFSVVVIGHPLAMNLQQSGKV